MAENGGAIVVGGEEPASLIARGSLQPPWPQHSPARKETSTPRCRSSLKLDLHLSPPPNRPLRGNDRGSPLVCIVHVRFRRSQTAWTEKSCKKQNCLASPKDQELVRNIERPRDFGGDRYSFVASAPNRKQQGVLRGKTRTPCHAGR
ncbi:unnamed protein product [Ectocarpus sp. 12 AP-2014]